MQNQYDTRELSSLKISGASIREFREVRSLYEMKEVVEYAKNNNLRLVVLGSGTNTVFIGKDLPIIAVRFNIKDMAIQSSKRLTVSAGTEWDEVVKFSIKNKLTGLEALSGIPGTAGAAPIQNIGAYGKELSDFFSIAHVYDTEENRMKMIDKDGCGFGYRSSIFKSNPGKYIIFSISLDLSNGKPEVPKYKDVENYFNERNVTSPTGEEIRNAVLEIRNSKIPDYRSVPNCGSFFTNPILEKEVVEKIKANNPDIPTYETENGLIKIPAGYLIEKAGLKGIEMGPFGTYEKNALILINKGNGNAEELLKFVKHIQDKVFEKFEIMLEVEPNLIG